MATAATASAPQQYTTTTTLVPAPSQQTHMVLHRQDPQVHQVVAQQASPTYQQLVQATPQQPMQTRIVHVSHRQVEEVPAAPVRQFVTFKNLRHLNTPGQQWEHCEHITIALSPDEMERKIRCHDIPGNDLVRCLTSMGVYRQRHVRKYEDKLNQREPDPSNWSWVLEGLGELRDKPKATPHTFWAIFQRNSRKDSTQQSRQIRVPAQVTVHQPAQIVQTAPAPVQQTQQYVAPALPAPAPQPLALPAPPVAQTSTYTTTAAAPAAVIQPASSVSGASTATYHTTTTAPVQTQFQNPAAYTQQQQQSRVYQQAQQVTAPGQALVALPAASTVTPQTTIVRQLTNGSSQGSPVAREYTRPLPAPYTVPLHSYAPRRAGSPLTSPRSSSSEIDVHQYQVRDHSPARWAPLSSPRREKERFLEDDEMSDHSASSYSSGSSASFADYTTKRPAPLGRHARSNASTRSGRKHGFNEARRSCPQIPHPHMIAHAPAPPPPRVAEERNYAQNAPARPTVHRENTYDVEVKFGTTAAARPGLVRRFTDTATPRACAADDSEDDHDHEDLLANYRRPHGHAHGSGRPSMPGSYSNNSYQAAGLVSYGSEGRRRSREGRF